MAQPSLKRPGILGWSGLGLLIVLAIGIIKVMFFAAIGWNTASAPFGVTSLAQNSYRTTSGGDTKAYGAPPVAPNDMSESAGSAAIAPMPPTTEPGPVPNEPQRIIKTGELTLRVTDTPKALTDIQTLVSSKNGFVASSNISDAGTGPRTAWVTLRVPADAFDATMQALKATAVVVLNENTHAQDVTSEFVDLDADLRNAQAEEASYLEIMKRAGDIPDVLDVAKSLADVRGRIERLEGRKRYLSNQTDLATISVTLTEETRVEVPGHTWKPLEVFRQSIQQLIESLQNLVDFLIQAVVAIVGLLTPILLIASFVIWIGWKIVKAIMRRMKK